MAFNHLAMNGNIPPTPPLDLYMRHDFSSSKGLAYGHGLVAVFDIPAGTLILMESPEYIDSMDTAEYTMKNASSATVDADSITSIPLITPVANHDARRLPHNVIPLTLSSSGSRFNEVGVFSIISCLNHSCQPNAQQTFNESIGDGAGMETVYALRDIVMGEEITISYYPEGRSIEETYLKDAHGFDCICTWCTDTLASVDVPVYASEILAHEKRDISARRRHLINISLKDIRVITAINVPYVMKTAHGLHWNLFKERINDWRVAVVYSAALDCAIEVKNRGRAREFAVRAYRAYAFCQGFSSPDVTKVKTRYEQFCRALNHPLTDEEKRVLWAASIRPVSTNPPSPSHVSNLFMREIWTEGDH